jgi:hypothetical protein
MYELCIKSKFFTMKFNPFLYLFFVGVFSIFGGCISDPNEAILEKANSDEKFVTDIEWAATEKNLGIIEEGQKIEVMYQFTNKGTKPLVIKSATATCGCTVPELPKEPIMPGKSGMLKAVFDSEGRSGLNHKSITVVTNTNPGQHNLDFTVEVNPRPQPKEAQNPS